MMKVMVMVVCFSVERYYVLVVVVVAVNLLACVGRRNNLEIVLLPRFFLQVD